MALIIHAQDDFANQTYRMILQEEALVRRVYNDGIGVPTLGVGVALIVNIGPRNNPNWQIRGDLDAILQQAGITLTDDDTRILERIRDLLNGTQPDRQQQIAQIIPVAEVAPGTREELESVSQSIINNDVAPENQFSFGTITGDVETLSGQARQLYDAVMNGVPGQVTALTKQVQDRLGNYRNADRKKKPGQIYFSCHP